ncbi:uncharacterized protein N7511_005327 [Penicillium nucicola]|uniref:uncharacterized protein n=1 Tax=Penicillium nucicola TaxID=1850975 RepID=UPI002545A4C2|nr:uncharacterized protein N7511_005327 [Penicillium nucicola]KAJ5761945.1 hypothetical protein N7511_005327 [Penicillium nucicola]
MSPTSTPQPAQEPTGSNTEARMRKGDPVHIHEPYKDEEEHPDAPLPQSSKSNAKYSDLPENDHESNDQEHDAYTCHSSTSQSDLETQNQALAQSEPRPIDEDEDEDDEHVYSPADRPRHAWQVLWLKNKGMALVLLAQMFGASMNVMTQILEIHSAMHPFQVLFARMSITALASYIYMYYASVPHPLGTKPVRPLLLLRASSGFMGVYGLYYSVQYLPLSEATVITFLAPIMTCYACSLLIPGETFSRRQQAAALVSLAGVVLIARPFGKRVKVDSVPTAVSVWAMGLNGGSEETPGDADAYHHVLATVVAFVGVVGAAGAYTSIRMIGKRAHPLVSVTYFSSVTTVISFLAMAFVPGVPFRLPGSVVEWSLLTGLGVCGFLLQFLLTAGLSYVPPASVSGGKVVGQGSKATSMVYMQMLFALFYDKVVWGVTMSGVSWIGSGLILICAVYVAVEGGKSPSIPAQSDGSGRGSRDVEGFKDATEETH